MALDAVVHVARANVPKGIKAAQHPENPKLKVWFTPIKPVQPCKETRYPGFLLKHYRGIRGVGRMTPKLPAPIGIRLAFQLGSHVKGLRKAKEARGRAKPDELRQAQIALRVLRNVERHKVRRAAKLAARAKTLEIISAEKGKPLAPEYRHASATVRLDALAT